MRHIDPNSVQFLELLEPPPRALARGQKTNDTYKEEGCEGGCIFGTLLQSISSKTSSRKSKKLITTHLVQLHT
jgi:hypothetical protein